MEFLNLKQKIIIGVICICIIITIAIYIIQKSNNKYEYIEYEELDNNKEEKTEEIVEEEGKIVLHIAGEVEEEGVIEIEEGARVIDAIQEAGGLTKDADISDVNLAYELKDGEKIYIPKEGEENTSYIIDGNTRKK